MLQFVIEPLGQRLGPMECEDLPAPCVRSSKLVKRVRLRCSGIGRARGVGGARNVVGNAFAVLLGLNLDTCEGLAFALGFDHAGGHTIHEEQVVRLPVSLLHWELADSNTPAGGDIGGCTVLHYPASGSQKLVNVLARPILGSYGHCEAKVYGDFQVN
jgi:hypothetical protein